MSYRAEEAQREAEAAAEAKAESKAESKAEANRGKKADVTPAAEDEGRGDDETGGRSTQP
jgi:hypothetical protein